MSRIRADQYEQGELASRRAGTRNPRFFFFGRKARSSVDLLHLFQERPSFSALRKIDKVEKTREIIHLFQIFRFSKDPGLNTTPVDEPFQFDSRARTCGSPKILKFPKNPPS